MKRNETAAERRFRLRIERQCAERFRRHWLVIAWKRLREALA